MKASDLRASLLISAFSGDLTKQWRIDNNIDDNSWHSLKLIDLCQSFADCPHSTPEWVEHGILCLRTFNILPRKLDLAVTSYVSERTYLERIERFVPQENDIVYSREGTSVCSACLIPKDLKLCLGQRLVIMRVKNDISPAYIAYYLNSPNVLTQVNKEERGIAAKHVNVKSIKNYQINIPSLAEQRRIVAKLDELMPLVDAYEKEEQQLSALEKAFPENLRKSILQEAVSGKLVPQIAEEGTAAELLKEIEAEKKALVVAGKIKKEKPLPEITEEEIPFEIPESWEWVRLGEIINLISGRDLESSEYTDKKSGVPYLIGASNINNGKILIERWTEKPQVLSHAGDLLLTCKGTVGKTLIQNVGDMHIARQIMALRPYSMLYCPYLKFVIDCFKEMLITNARSMIPGISRNHILLLLFPLPPLAEQRRIVAKVDELMKLVDTL